MAGLARRMVADWPLKLSSLGLALLLWALVSVEQVTTLWVMGSVQVDVRDDDYRLVSRPRPDTVRVLVEGPTRLLWRLAVYRPVVVVAVREPGARRDFALEPGMVRLPEAARGVRVHDVRPGTVRLSLQRVATREVPVQPRPRGAGGAAGLGLFPATVRVTGPAEALARLREVETMPFEVGPGDFERRVRLDTAGLGELTLSHASVLVRGDGAGQGERLLPRVPVRGAEGDSVAVVLSGPEAALRDVDVAGVWVERTGDGLRVGGVPAGVLARRAASAPADTTPPAGGAEGAP